MNLDGLVNTILGFGTAIAKDRLQRSELVIKLLKNLGLDPDHPPADFTAVYQYALVEYGVGKPKPVLDIFRQVEIQQIFRRALDQNNPAILLKEGEAFLAEHRLGDELQALGLNAQRELYGFAAVFLEIAKRTRTPAEVLTNQRLDSLHRQLGTMQERLNRLPTLEGIRTEMARLAEQGVPAASESSAAQQCRAFALAQQMRGWFETLGYRFEPTEVWADDYFEWILNIPVRRNRFDRILVRGIAGEAGLRDVLALGQSVAAQRTDEGWMVTARRISRAARDAVEQPENRHLDCYTFDELVDLDADFSGYIAWLEAEILRRGVATQYVPLACAKEELDPVTKQRVTVSRYDERDGWIDGYCDRWLDDSTKEHISVLGEFGTGKTWFAFHYAGVALQRYQEAKERGTQRPRLPLVITLRDYAKALNVENVLAGFFFTQHNIRLNSEVFDQLNRMGKLLLIFDGFDEMAAKVDRQQMINNFWELAKVVVPGAKVILTCRTEHFPEAQDGRALLNAELQASTANLTGETPQFEVLELEKFTDKQIRRVLALQATAATVEQVMGNPQLLDLARRPVMTELILEALPDIEAGKPVDMSRVYLYAVRRKMERDIKAERTFTSLADKLYFMCELSWEMLSTDQMSLNYREFPDRIRKLFGAMVQEEKDLDHWHYDMMGQTMLIRNADGDYTPAHRSLLEFFVAYKFAAELGALAPDFLELAQMRSDVDSSLPAREYTWSEYFGDRTQVAPLLGFVGESLERLRPSFGQTPLTKALIDLLSPMIIPDDSMLEFPLKNVITKTRNQSFLETGYVGGNAATLLVKAKRGALSGCDFSNTVICGADFSTARLIDTNFTNAILTDSIFPKMFGSIFTIAHSPNSEIFATAGATCVIDLWKVKSSEPYLTLKGHVEWIRSLAFSPDGKALLSASFDETIRVWDLKTGECTQTFRGHTNRINSVTISFDSRYAFSASDDCTIKVWDLHTGDCLSTLEGHTAAVEAVLVSTDTQTLISAGSDHCIKIWNFSSSSCLHTLNGHTDRVRYLALSSDGKNLASSAFDQTIRLWDLSTNECVKVFSGHTHRKTSSIAFSRDDSILVSSSYDQTIKVWNAQTGECLKTLVGHSDWVRIVTFDSDNHIVSGSDDQTIKSWDAETGECLSTLTGITGQVRSIAISPDGTTLAIGTEESSVKLWKGIDDNLSKTLEIKASGSFRGHDSRINSVRISSNGDFLATASFDQSAKIWDLKTSLCRHVLIGHVGCVNEVAFTSDNHFLATVGADCTVKLWDMETGVCIFTLEAHKDWLWAVAICPHDNILASGGNDKIIMLWNLQSGEFIGVLEGHSGSINSIVFTPDGKTLISASSDATIRFWDLEIGENIKVLTGHTNYILCLDISPGGNRLASSGQDKTIRIWDVKTGACLKTLVGHSDGIRSVVFTPDGNRLISGSFDRSLKVWDVETGECLKTLRPVTAISRMNITGVKGLTEAEKATLRALGAVEDSSIMND